MHRPHPTNTETVCRCAFTGSDDRTNHRGAVCGIVNVYQRGVRRLDGVGTNADSARG